MRVLTSEEARSILDVREPIPVAWTSKDGTLRADDGEKIDPRQAVPWVWALGPFGSWPCTLEEAEKTFEEQPEWILGQSMRIGWAVSWKNYWGYGAKGPEE